jgi:hypothetical protein
MLRLLYVSCATTAFSNTNLLEMVNKARARNEALDVTGMLLYKDGNFIQALEGKGSAVREIFETIRRDPRHRAVTVVLNEIDNARHFGQPLGFRHLTDPEGTIVPSLTPAVSVCGRKPRLRRGVKDCLELLESFQGSE